MAFLIYDANDSAGIHVKGVLLMRIPDFGRVSAFWMTGNDIDPATPGVIVGDVQMLDMVGAEQPRHLRPSSESTKSRRKR
jgi:hypothetical protein